MSVSGKPEKQRVLEDLRDIREPTLRQGEGRAWGWTKDWCWERGGRDKRREARKDERKKERKRRKENSHLREEQRAHFTQYTPEK